MPEQAQEQARVGDTVRLWTSVEGVVYKLGDSLYVSSLCLDIPGRPFEILSRPDHPLPSEPGTWWLDKWSQVWWINAAGGMSCISNRIGGIPESYAPFRQLVLK